MAGRVTFLFTGRGAASVSETAHPAAYGQILYPQNLRDQLLYCQFFAAAGNTAYDFSLQGRQSDDTPYTGEAGAGSSGIVLIAPGGTDFVADGVALGQEIFNVTDGQNGNIIFLNSTTIAASGVNTWNPGDVYSIPALKQDPQWTQLARWEWTSGVAPPAGRGEMDVSFDGLDAEGGTAGNGTVAPRSLLVGPLPALNQIRAEIHAISVGSITCAVTEM